MSDDLPIVKRLCSSAARMANDVLDLTVADLETIDEAAALIREQHAALVNIRAIADDMGGKTPAQRCSWIVDECDAALSRAKGEK